MSPTELRSIPYGEYLQSHHWQTVRRAALDHYGTACVLCGAQGDNVDVHHRTYERRGEERLHDLTVLCRPCHQRFHQQVSDDIPFGDEADIREHFERLIASEQQAA